MALKWLLQEPCSPRCKKEYKGELPYLGQGRSGQDSYPQREPHDGSGKEGDDELAHDDGHGQAENQKQVVEDVSKIEQHADGDEEHAGENVAQRDEIGDRLLAVTATGND